MRTREVWKRVLAWMLTTAMVVGSSSFAAADEVASDFSAQEETVVAETELSGEEADAPYTDMETPAAEPDIFVPSDEELLEEGQDTLVVTDEQDQVGEAQPESEMTGTEPGMEDADGIAVGEDQGLISIEDVEVVEHGLKDEGAAVVTSESAGDPVPEIFDGVFEDGGSYEVTLESEGDDCKWYTFTPQKDGVYVVYSGESEGDPYIDVYTRDAEGNLAYFAADDDSAGSTNFLLQLSLRADTTYYFKLTNYFGDSDFYRVYFRSIPVLQSISLQRKDSALVSGFCDITDLYKSVTATLTYENEKTSVISDSTKRRNVDEYGTILTYSVLDSEVEEEDELSSGVYTLTASAQECSASIEIPVLSMSEAATQKRLELGQTLTMENSNYESRLFAGFTPQESGEYIFANSGNDIAIYDIESEMQVDVGYFERGYRASLTTGKTYLIVVYLYDDTEVVTLSVTTAKKIASIEFKDLKNSYDVLDAANDLNGLSIELLYEGATSPETYSGWFIDDWDEGGASKWYYRLTASEGEVIRITMWDGAKQVDMPTYYGGSVSGSYTLKVSSEGKEYAQAQITINPLPEASSVALALNESRSVTSDAAGKAYCTFKPDKTGVYTLSGTNTSGMGINVRLYGQNNEYITSAYASGQDWGFTYLLEAGVAYSYSLSGYTGGMAAQVKLVETEMGTLTLGTQSISGLDDTEKWFRFTPDTSAVYSWQLTSADDDWSYYIEMYDDSDAPIDSGYYMTAGKTYYCRITGLPSDVYELSMNRETVTPLSLGQSFPASKGSWFSFVPEESVSYNFYSTGLTDAEGDIYLYDDRMNYIRETYLDYEDEFHLFCALEKGKTYLLKLDLYTSASDTFTVAVSKGMSVEKISVNDAADRFFEAGYVDLEDTFCITYKENGSTDTFTRWNDFETTDDFNFVIRGALYEADAFGNPNYEKRVEEDWDEGGYNLKSGIYARVIEIGTWNGNGDFVKLSDIAPIVMKVFVTEQGHTAHTFETVTVKAATCAAAGSAKKRCIVCGYEDPTLVSIPATGKHTGGKATCTKKAVCSVCGQEYGALAAHSFGAWKKTSEATVFKKAVQTRSCSVCGKQETQEVGNTAAKIIKLNASSLKMKVKQKTTKLTVTMGPGDSISSVKSSNTKVLKATVKGGKIMLTAQKKTGTAKLTIKLASGVSKTIKVTVQKKAVTTKSIKGVSKKLTLKKKKKTTLKPELNPITSQDKIKYSSSNKKVATVNSNGVVTAKKAGKAIITIKAGKKSFKCTITVK